MNTSTIILLIVIMFIIKVFALRSGAKNIEQAIDYWLTAIYCKKHLENKATKRGFLDLYQKELEFRSDRFITQMQCYHAFHAAQYKHRKLPNQSQICTKATSENEHF